MNVIVIGGGASGLMAAITAAKGGHSVTLLERQARVGRKLLSTGNLWARCPSGWLCVWEKDIDRKFIK